MGLFCTVCPCVTPGAPGLPWDWYTTYLHSFFPWATQKSNHLAEVVRSKSGTCT